MLRVPHRAEACLSSAHASNHQALVPIGTCKCKWHPASCYGLIPAPDKVIHAQVPREAAVPAPHTECRHQHRGGVAGEQVVRQHLQQQQHPWQGLHRTPNIGLVVSTKHLLGPPGSQHDCVTHADAPTCLVVPSSSHTGAFLVLSCVTTTCKQMRQLHSMSCHSPRPEARPMMHRSPAGRWGYTMP